MCCPAGETPHRSSGGDREDEQDESLWKSVIKGAEEFAFCLSGLKVDACLLFRFGMLVCSQPAVKSDTYQFIYMHHIYSGLPTICYFVGYHFSYALVGCLLATANSLLPQSATSTGECVYFPFLYSFLLVPINYRLGSDLDVSRNQTPTA